MPQEVIFASQEGCAGGKADDTADLQAFLNDCPTGSKVVLNGRYRLGAGVLIEKVLNVSGAGARSEIYFNPTTSGDTAFRFQATNAAIQDKNEEGQLYGPIISDIRVIAKREKLANAFHIYRGDKTRFENVLIEGIRGSSVVLDRSRESVMEAVTSRFCGDRATQTSDIRLISNEGSADTSNYQSWDKVYSIFPQWTGIELDNADKIMMGKVMVHMYPSAGDAGFLNNFHIFANNRFGFDLFQDWLDHFDDATTGGRFCHAIDAKNGSSLNVDLLQIVGGRQEKVLHSEGSVFHYANGWVVGGNEVNGYLNFADNGGSLTWGLSFFDGSWQVFGGANGGVCGGLCQLGPSFSATQLLTAPGVVEEWFGGDLKMKRLLRIMNHMEIAEGGNVTLGTATGSKFGTSSSQKLGFWGATPITRPTVSGAKAGNAALTSLLSQLAAAGLITDLTT